MITHPTIPHHPQEGARRRRPPRLPGFRVLSGLLLLQAGMQIHAADDPGLAFYATCDDVNAILAPKVGPEGTLTGIPYFVSGYLGNAYLVNAATANKLHYPGSIIPINRGTFECWAKLVSPPSTIPWHASPNLFSAATGIPYSGYQLGFNGNDGWSGGGLVSAAGHGTMATGDYSATYTYASILGSGSKVTSWHHHAVTWDIDGVPGGHHMQQYLDGQPVGTLLHDPDSFPAATDFVLGFIQDNYGSSAVAIDEVKIWNFAKTTFDVPPPPPPTPALVFYTTCDSESALRSPRKGPAGTLTGSATIVPGYVGNAYQVNASTANRLSFPGTIVPADRGTIECWAKLTAPPITIPWHSSPTLFGAGVTGTPTYCSYQIGFNGNDGWSDGGFIAWAGNGVRASGSYTGSYTYASVLGGAAQVEAWHHYAITWDINGILGAGTRLQAFIDGRATGTMMHEPDQFPTGTERFLVGLIDDHFGGGSVAIDEFKIWNFAKTTFDVPPPAVPPIVPALVFSTNCDSESSLRSPQKGPNGTLTGPARIVSGYIGNAYQVDAASSGQLHYPGSIIPIGRGTFECWAKLVSPPSTIPWHASPNLFSAATGIPYSGYQLGFNGNDGWSGGGLVSAAGHGTMATGDYATTYTYAGVLGGASTSWHHHAVAWDINGVPGSGGHHMQQYLDGKPVGTLLHDPDAFPAATDFVLGFIQDNYGSSAVAIDEVKIWNFAKTTFDVPPPAPATPALVFYGNCDSESSLRSPKRGPAGTLTGSASIVPGYIGNAYQVDASTANRLSYPGTIVPANRGTIECWAKLTAPPVTIPWHASPDLFSAGVTGTPTYSGYHVGFSGNDGWSDGGFIAWAGNGVRASGSYTGTYTYANVLGGATRVETWHHYALTWDITGILRTGTRLQAFIDGQPTGVMMHEPDLFPTGSDRFMVGIIDDLFGGGSVAIDELKIWNYAKTTFDVPPMAPPVGVGGIPGPATSLAAR